MNRLTKLDKDITKVKGTYMPYNEQPVVTLSSATYVQCMLNKLGGLEDLIDEMDSVRIVKRDGIISLHIDMILTSETLPIVKEIFKDKLKENKEE